MVNRSMIAVLVIVASSTSAGAQPNLDYAVPRTPHGHPDLQGVWATEFLTMLERPRGVENLVAGPEQARAMAAAIRSRLPGNIDPQVLQDDLNELVAVQGEYRTSVVVEPEDGRIPYTQAGADLATQVGLRNEQFFDGPEQRPWSERCMENLAFPPMRSLPVSLPHQFFQTQDYVVIASEGPASVRLIHLSGQSPPHALRSVEGDSRGRWEGDTLVVETTHFRADDPARHGIGRPVLLSRDSVVTERFTRVGDRELFYQYTVEDEKLYATPWTGEFSLKRLDARIYEYACHEGNYSMPTVLVGGQAQSASRNEAESQRK